MKKKIKGSAIITISIYLSVILIVFLFYYWKGISALWQLKDGYWGTQNFSHENYKMIGPTYVYDLNWYGKGEKYQLTRDTLHSPEEIAFYFTLDLRLTNDYLRQFHSKGGIIVDVKKDTIITCYKELPMFKINPKTNQPYERKEIWKFSYIVRMKKDFVVGEVKERIKDLSL